MAFVSRLLSDHEELVAESLPHPAALAAPGALLLAAAAGAIAIGVAFPGAPVAVIWVLAAMVGLPALWLLGRAARWRATRLVVTSHRIVYRRGLFGRDLVQLRLQRVAEVHCVQSLTDRLIGRGRLVIEVMADDPVEIAGVRRPRALQRMISESLDRLDAVYEPAAAPPAGAPPPGAPPPGRGSGPWAGSLPAAPARHPGSGATRWDSTPPHGVAATGGAGVPTPAGAGDPTDPWGVATDRVHGDAASSDPGASVPARLVQLDELRRRGIISEEEFAAKKAELLSRL